MDSNGAMVKRIEPEPPPMVYESIRVGGLQVGGPAEVTAVAAKVAKELAKIIGERGLYTKIQGRDYVNVEGWCTAAAMLGVIPREASVTEGENGDYTAVVELVRASDGVVIGRGSALCGGDENPWGKRPRYARRSMAVTRATGKACRLAFSWIVALAGYEPTPMEEMPSDGVDITNRNVPPVTPAPDPKLAQAKNPAKLSFARAAQKWTGMSGKDLADASELIAHSKNLPGAVGLMPGDYIELAKFCDDQRKAGVDFLVWQKGASVIAAASPEGANLTDEEIPF